MNWTKRACLVLFGVAALMALTASSAQAGNTTFCKKVELPCAAANQWPKGTKIDGLSTTASVLKTNIGNVICQHSDFEGEITSASLANPLVVSLTAELLECELEGGGECEVTAIAGLALFLKTGPNAASWKLHNVRKRVRCAGFIDCEYEFTGETEALSATESEPAVLHGSEMELEKAGGLLCPESATLGVKYEITALEGANKKVIYISS
jgi:hypothetical protein